MTRKTKKYTKEFKEESVKLALSSPSVTGVAKELNIPEATLHAWVAKDRMNKNQSVMTSEGLVTDMNTLKILEENKQLKKQLARLEQEKAILKKAATYFAKELE
jgi:transposase